MPRLFVAIELPAEVRGKLTQLMPSPCSGLRLVTTEQLHLTLHFIGENEIEPITSTLTEVHSSPFPLRLEGVGRFPPRGRATILWAGVQNSSELQTLYSTMGDALESIGFTPESRPFSPHITLARCGYKVNQNVVEAFLTQHAAFSIPAFSVEGFSLYSSTISDAGPIYRCERRFAFKKDP